MAGNQDPQTELAAGRVPTLEELRRANGTIGGWNRPISTWPTGCRTCGWRTGCCRRARAWWT